MTRRRRTVASVRRAAFEEAADKVDALAARYRRDAGTDAATAGQRVWAVAAITAIGIAAALRTEAGR